LSPQVPDPQQKLLVLPPQLPLSFSLHPACLDALQLSPDLRQVGEKLIILLLQQALGYRGLSVEVFRLVLLGTQMSNREKQRFILLPHLAQWALRCGWGLSEALDFPPEVSHRGQKPLVLCDKLLPLRRHRISTVGISSQSL